MRQRPKEDSEKDTDLLWMGFELVTTRLLVYRGSPVDQVQIYGNIGEIRQGNVCTITIQPDEQANSNLAHCLEYISRLN